MSEDASVQLSDASVKRQYPILSSARLRSVPWALLAPHEAQAQRNHYQTLERLAQRGGLSPCEVLAIIDGRSWSTIIPNPPKDDARLVNLVNAFRRGPLPDAANPASGATDL